LPTRIELEATTQSALDEISYACCEDIRAISERRLVRSLGRVDPLVMLSVSRTLRLFLDD
jgi:mRNA-degrading endonuclease toxin of MazEF toxin-antitoxin module